MGDSSFSCDLRPSIRQNYLYNSQVMIYITLPSSGGALFTAGSVKHLDMIVYLTTHKPLPPRPGT